MTMPDIPGGENWQPEALYPTGFILAVKPDELAPYNCVHDDDSALSCQCVHDWRIHWGNKPKKTAAKATYIE